MRKLTKDQIAANATETDAATDAKQAPAVSCVREGWVLRFAFGDGTGIDFIAQDVNQEILDAATMHGFEQKIRDAAALSVRNVNGRVTRPTVAEKATEIRAMIAQLQSGVWNAKRESGVGNATALWDAVQVVYAGKFADRAEFDAKLASAGAALSTITGEPVGEETVRKALSARSDVAAEMARQRAARRTDTGESNDALSAMGI